MKSVFAVIALAALATVPTQGVELDGSNFEDTIQGKGAFVKFLAPW
jgi:hypothetical protein